MSGINLGNVVGLLVSATAPTKKYVIWAKPNPSNDDDYTLFKYDAIASEWKPYDVDRSYFLPAVIALGTNTLPSSPSLEDAYLIGDAPTGIAVGHAQEHALWNGYSWIFIEPKEGASCRSKTDPNATYVFNSGAWVLSSISVTGYIPTTGTVTGYDISGDLVTEDTTLVKFGRDFTATGGSQGSWFEVQHGAGAGTIGMYSRGIGLGFTAGITVNYSGGVFLDAYNSTITANNQLKLYSTAQDLWLSAANNDILMFAKNLKLPTRTTADRGTGNGYIAYNTDTNKYEGYIGGTWKDFVLGSDALPISGGTLTGFLTLHADPTNAMHAATKGYVDNAITGLNWKYAVRVATVSNITLSGTQTVDGVLVSVGDRVLVKNQSTATENGIYLVAAGAWTRTTDADTGAEIVTAAVLITTGTQANTQWTCTNSTPPTIGTTAITFGQIAGAGVYTNGTGISLIGNVFSISNSYAGQTSITTLGTIGAGTWQGTAIADAYIASAATWNGNVTTEVWNTNANYTITNTTAKILVIEQDGTLTAPRTITLSVLPTGSILVIRGGASITATNVINIAGFVNGISTYTSALTLPYQSLVLYSLGGGFYTTNKPQFTETTTALTSQKYIRSASGIGLKGVTSFTPTWDTGVAEGDLNWHRSGLSILARDGSSNTIPFMPYASFGGWQNYRPTTLQYWNGQNISSGNKPTEYASALGYIYYWNRHYIVKCFGEATDNYLEVLIFVNGSGVPSIVRVLQESSVFSITLSGGTLQFTGGNAYVCFEQVPQTTTTNLRGSYNWVYQQGGTDVRFQGNLGLGSSTINSLTQLDLQGTTRGLGLNLVAGDLGTTRNGLIWYDTVSNTLKGIANATVRTLAFAGDTYKFDELLQLTDCNATFATANTVVYMAFIPKGDIAVTKIYYNLQSAGTDTVRVGIYADASNSPTTLIVQANEATTGATTTGHRSITISSTNLTAGTRYWIAIKNDNGASSFLSKNNVYSNNITKESSTSGVLVASPTTYSSLNAVWMGIGV